MTNKSRQKIWSETDILLMAPKKGAHYNYCNSEWPQVPTYSLEFYYDNSVIQKWRKIAQYEESLSVTREFAH